MDTGSPTPHRWRFFRLGGFDQVRLDTAEDLLRLHELDQKLWAALSCPVSGLEFDPRTLAMLDTDGDGRIRVPEILAAVEWVCAVLRDLRPVLAGSSALPLAAINDAVPEGRRLLASARQIQNFLGQEGAEAITIEHVAGTEALLHDSPFNGDGVITPASARDQAMQGLIEEIMACVGSVQDRGGAPGIAAEQIESFYQAAARYVEWHDQALRNAQAVLPLGENTTAARDLVNGLRVKLDDYFTRCDLAAFDPKAQDALNPALTAYEAISPNELRLDADLERFPLARIEADRPLPLESGLNPAWAGAVATFKASVVVPLFGDADSLERAQWERIKSVLEPYEAWLAEKTGGEVESVGLERLRELLAGDSRQELEKLIAEDLSLAEQVESFDGVARLVHLTRDLVLLLNNFVAFRDFYFQDRKAIFQAGTLYLDGRACELCVRVANPTLTPPWRA